MAGLNDKDYIIEVSKMNNNYAKVLSFMKSLASTECWSSLEIVENRAQEILREIGEANE